MRPDRAQLSPRMIHGTMNPVADSYRLALHAPAGDAFTQSMGACAAAPNMTHCAAPVDVGEGCCSTGGQVLSYVVMRVMSSWILCMALRMGLVIVRSVERTQQQLQPLASQAQKCLAAC